jgi:hypothetical protein
MALAGYVGVASRALTPWSAWVGYVCALACLAFVPSMFVGSPDLMHFYNPAGWGPEAIASGFPLAVWMITVSVLMIRVRKPVAARAAVAL